MADLKITKLSKSYGAFNILKSIDLDITSGEFIVFVGPSGCGKSTLLRCIAGLEEITDGTLEIDGHVVNDISPAERGIAMVFQSYALYPHMNVFDNMAYSLKIAGLPKAEIKTRVEAAARKLELTAYLTRTPRMLSGGQRQRVAIGRAIVRNPRVFLFDEPLSNLDASLRVQMRLEIGQLKQQLANTTMVYVTHDQVEAMTLADRIVVLNGGLIEQVGTPTELYENPATQFVAGFIGSPKINFLGGVIAARYGAATIGIRPEQLAILANGSGDFDGKVIYSENLGADSFIYLDVGAGGEPISVRLPGRVHFDAGSTLSLAPVAGSTPFRFGKEGERMLH